MNGLSGARDVEGMERSLHGLAGSLRDAARLLRALAPVAEELRSVQAAMAEWQLEAPASPVPAPPAPTQHQRRSVSVAVARMDGPLDPGVIQRALATTPGVLTAEVNRVDRGRLSARVETDRTPADLRLHDALLAVFTEGVSGGWNGDAEFIAVVGPEVVREA
jgi:hypothetical protein